MAGLWRRQRRMTIAVVTAMLVIAAFLLWGPIGLGNGPLNVEMGGTEGGTAKHQTPTGFILPIYNFGGSSAIVDSVDLVGGTRYPSPRILALGVLTSAACGGAWPARIASNGFVMIGCGGHYRGRLIGRAVPTTPHISPGFPAAAEAAAPRPGTCWVLTKVVVHYHVGIRHYAATDPFQLAVCAPDAVSQADAAMKAAEGLG